MSIGDIIKMGRVRFRIKYFCTKPRVEDKKEMNVSDFLPNMGSDSKQHQKAPLNEDPDLICRVCLMED